MFHKSFAVPALALATLMPSHGFAAPDDLDRAIYDALLQDQVVQILRAEGFDYGLEIAEQMFPGQLGPAWMQTLTQIYDPDMMAGMILEEMSTQLEGTDRENMLAFLEDDLGQSIVASEVEARGLISSEEVEERAKEKVADIDDDRLELLDEFVESYDLIERNVSDGMNATYAFYQGLMDADGFAGDITPDQILSNVWSQEEEIRDNTTEWMYAFVNMAFAPFPDEDLETYLAFADSEPGQDLNHAIFAAYNVLFTEISRAMGYAAGQMMQGSDL